MLAVFGFVFFRSLFGPCHGASVWMTDSEEMIPRISRAVGDVGALLAVPAGRDRIRGRGPVQRTGNPGDHLLRTGHP